MKRTAHQNLGQNQDLGALKHPAAMKKSLSLAVRCSTLRNFIARTDLKKKRGNKKKGNQKNLRNTLRRAKGSGT